MLLIDSHNHLHDREFFSETEAEAMLERAHEKKVEKIICVGTSHEDSLTARDFANTHENVYWSYGIHPENASEESDIVLSRHFATKGERVHLVAVGEVGLDYHYDGYNRKAQIKLFNEMLQLAKDNNLPVIFHVREAFEDFFGVMNNFPEIRGVVHSFTDSKKTLKKILNETNYYVGVNGLATYSTLPLPPLDRILLETDAPFLAPVPFRGKTNEPAYIYNIAEWLAAKLEISLEEVANQTAKNTHELFINL